MLKGGQEEAQRLRPQEERSKAAQEPGELISKIKNMVTDGGFVNEAITQMENVVETSEDTAEMKAILRNLLLGKIKESFKNGLEIGMRGRGQNRPNRKPYRKFRR